jgi:hypothetical protein
MACRHLKMTIFRSIVSGYSWGYGEREWPAASRLISEYNKGTSCLRTCSYKSKLSFVPIPPRGEDREKAGYRRSMKHGRRGLMNVRGCWRPCTIINCLFTVGKDVIPILSWQRRYRIPYPAMDMTMVRVIRDNFELHFSFQLCSSLLAELKGMEVAVLC